MQLPQGTQSSKEPTSCLHGEVLLSQIQRRVMSKPDDVAKEVIDQAAVDKTAAEKAAATKN
jgi:hypothetical protein